MSELTTTDSIQNIKSLLTTQVSSSQMQECIDFCSACKNQLSKFLIGQIWSWYFFNFLHYKNECWSQTLMLNPMSLLICVWHSMKRKNLFYSSSLDIANADSLVEEFDILDQPFDFKLKDRIWFCKKRVHTLVASTAMSKDYYYEISFILNYWKQVNLIWIDNNIFKANWYNSIIFDFIVFEFLCLVYCRKCIKVIHENCQYSVCLTRWRVYQNE